MVFVPIWTSRRTVQTTHRELLEIVCERAEQQSDLELIDRTARRVVYERAAIATMRASVSIDDGGYSSRLRITVFCAGGTLWSAVFLPLFLAMWCWGVSTVFSSESTTSGAKAQGPLQIHCTITCQVLNGLARVRQP